MIDMYTKTPKILVIGDLIVDQYLWGKSERISPEAPVQVINIEKGKWKNAGITKGFIVTSINKRAISDVEDLSTTLSQLPKDDGVLVEGMYPNGIKAYYGIGW